MGLPGLLRTEVMKTVRATVEQYGADDASIKSHRKNSGATGNSPDLQAKFLADPFWMAAANPTKVMNLNNYSLGPVRLAKSNLLCRIALFAIILIGASNALAAHLTATTTTVSSSNTNSVFG